MQEKIFFDETKHEKIKIIQLMPCPEWLTFSTEIEGTPCRERPLAVALVEVENDFINLKGTTQDVRLLMLDGTFANLFSIDDFPELIMPETKK